MNNYEKNQDPKLGDFQNKMAEYNHSAIFFSLFLQDIWEGIGFYNFVLTDM